MKKIELQIAFPQKKLYIIPWENILKKLNCRKDPYFFPS